MRLLIENVARLRPGPVLLHDIPADDEAVNGLQQAYKLLLADPSGPLPSNGSVSLYYHPENLVGSTRKRTDRNKLLTDLYALLRNSSSFSSETEPPAWLIKSIRVLEQSVANRLDATPPHSNEQRAVSRGAEEALEFVAELIKQQVEETQGPGEDPKK
jgi:hypothetical protein